MEMYLRVCDYCRRNVDVGEGLVEDSIWYHQSCWVSVQGKRLKKLSKKIESGQVTAQEAKEYDDLRPTYQNVCKSGPGVNLSSKLNTPLKSENAIYLGSACKRLGLENHKKTSKKLIEGAINEPMQARIMD